MISGSYHQPGTAPATLIPRGEAKPVITLIEYDASGYEERKVEQIEEVFACRDNKKVSWINVEGLGDVEVLRKLGEHFGLHPLALEDVLHIGQRPKVEEYEKHYFITSQIPYSGHIGKVDFEQMSLFFGANFLITIQEDPTRDVLEPLRVRLRTGRGFARTRGHDYLAYAILDAVVDHYFPVLEPLGDKIERIEEKLLQKPTPENLSLIHILKRTLVRLRRNAWPMREVLSAMSRDESGLVARETTIFLRDCYDHTVQIMDVIESYRDLITSIMDVYLSSVGIRTNEIMRVLTVVSTIFIPLTFIVGVYGMNFENMPELKFPHGYPICLAVMAIIAAGMLLIFRKKKWL